MLQIEIIDPKAKRLLEDLADMGVIRIKENSLKDRFSALLDESRTQHDSLPTIDEITREVEQVRSDRYKSNEQ